MSNSAHTVRRLSSALRYLERHLSEKMTLEMIADAAFCSKFHFHRLFAKWMGMTIHEYLQRRRLTEAARALAFSKASILHIALEAGYESQQAFTGVFKAMYKRPPGAFRESAAFYPLQMPAELSGGYFSSGGGTGRLRVRPAAGDDIPGWMCLLRQVVDGFPCLHEGEHRQRLEIAIARERAFICEDYGNVIGAMIFSRDMRMIDFLGVHPFHRNSRVAEAMLRRALSELPEIAITTYREGDKADTGHRKSLKNLGFTEAELLTEFGYPTQKFILRRSRHRRRKR